ncbi:MAG: electron transport complex subunit RsxE [Lachnospiraceae bacterium]|nr:electron transport complex subunit RsxE [Lachnospiraceae bacterium]
MNLAENTPLERLFNGIVKENPTLVIVLGMCPTLAVTTSAMNGIGMGLSTTVVLALANLFISLLRNVIPDDIRIPSFIVIIASFVTMVDMLMQAYTPDLYKSLGIYIPLIVVNCIIFGRAEAYAYKNKPLASFFDGIGMGLGFTLAITVMGFIRELIGSGAIFGNPIGALPDYAPAIFVMAPGAFLVLAIMITIRAHIINTIEAKKGVRLPVTHTDEEGSECSSCAMRMSCAGKFQKVEAMMKADKEAKTAAAKPAAPKAEAPEAPKAEEVHAEAPEAPKAEEVKAEVPEAPKAEEVHAEAPESPKEEEVKAEAPEAPKAEEVHAEAPESPKAEEVLAEESGDNDVAPAPVSALERLKAMKAADQAEKEANK